MKKILILSNHHAYTYNFRKEIIKRLIDEGCKVYIVLPYGEKVELLKEMGCEFIDLPLDRRGMNPIKDLKLIRSYYDIISEIKPDAILSYTVKPNIYGGIVSRIKNIPFFPNITGLGSAVENESSIQKLIIKLYKVAFKKATCVFFQNEENKNFFLESIFVPDNYRVIPGSGVNIEQFSPLQYPTNESTEFVFISRIMKEKGIDQYLDAATVIKKKYPETNFHILGFCEENYEATLAEMQKKGIIHYHGMQSDVKKFIKKTHCTIHPTYYPEGISNVLLESAACARPIITSNRSGCREVVDEGINGYLIEQQNSQDLIDKIESFLKLSMEDKKKMGLAGRRKVKREFDRDIVVSAYIEEMSKVSSLQYKLST